MRSQALPAYCYSGHPLVAVDGVIVHYFSGQNVEPDDPFNLHVCRNLFLDLNRHRKARQFYMKGDNWPAGRMYASAHILIGREAEVIKLIEFDKQAYHAGASLLNGRPWCNRWCLGVELVGTQTSGFTRAQYVALVDLLIDLERDYGIPRENVAGHDAVRWAAIQAGGKQRKYKYDPSGRKDGTGHNFDWFYLGKLWNDRVPNPAGTDGLDRLPAILDADPNSS